MCTSKPVRNRWQQDQLRFCSSRVFNNRSTSNGIGFALIAVSKILRAHVHRQHRIRQRESHLPVAFIGRCNYIQRLRRCLEPPGRRLWRFAKPLHIDPQVESFS